MGQHSASILGLPFEFVNNAQVPAEASGSAIPGNQYLSIANKIVDGSKTRYDMNSNGGGAWPPLQYDVNSIYDIPELSTAAITTLAKKGSELYIANNGMWKSALSQAKLNLTKIHTGMGMYSLALEESSGRFFATAPSTSYRVIYSDDNCINWTAAAWTLNAHCDWIFARGGKIFRIATNPGTNELTLSQSPWTSSGSISFADPNMTLRDVWSDDTGDYLLVSSNSLGSQILHFDASGNLNMGTLWTLPAGSRLEGNSLARNSSGQFLISTTAGQVFTGPSKDGPWTDKGQKFGGNGPNHLVALSGKWAALFDPTSSVAADVYTSADASTWTKLDVSLGSNAAVAYNLIPPLIQGGILYLMNFYGETLITSDLTNWTKISPIPVNRTIGTEFKGDLLLSSYNLGAPGYQRIGDNLTFSGNNDPLKAQATSGLARIDTMSVIHDDQDQEIWLFSTGGASGTIYRSTDQGQTWTATSGSVAKPRSCPFVQLPTGEVLGIGFNNSNGSLRAIISSNYGTSWQDRGVSTPASTSTTYVQSSLIQLNDDEVLFCGHDLKAICRYEIGNNGFYRYVDAGLPTGKFVGLAQGNNRILAAYSNGTIWKSTDRGTSWTQIATMPAAFYGTGNPITAADFCSSVLTFDGEFFICANANGIYKSGDGVDWETLYLDTNPISTEKNYFSFAIRTQQGVFCGGNQALVLVS